MQKDNCCTLLETAGLKHVYYPSSEGYKTRTDSYFSVSSQLQPYCIVQPESTEDVSTIIKTLVPDTTCNLAIRSGGHTVWAANNSRSHLVKMFNLTLSNYLQSTMG
jgi:FAD/FMN-containing dehydrogenase